MIGRDTRCAAGYDSDCDRCLEDSVFKLYDLRGLAPSLIEQQVPQAHDRVHQ
jgi:hypothetical protein